MKGLILAGGRGTRLRPLTSTLPKQLIPVANRPILHYVVERVARAGIEEIGVIVSPETGMQIRAALGGWPENVAFTFIEQESPLGIAHAVRAARAFLREDPFLMHLGDNLIGGELRPFVEAFRESHPAALVLLKEVEDPRLFGVARLDGSGCVIGFVEKPEEPPSSLALVGIYAFSAEVHSVIEQLKPSWRGELEITDALQLLIDGGHDVRSLRLDQWWLDTGKSDDLLRANRMVLGEIRGGTREGRVDDESEVSGPVWLGRDASIERSVVHGPVVIGSGTRVVSSAIGPHTSLGPDCSISWSSVGDSVVLDRATIENVSLTASVVGAGARVAGSGPDSRAARIVVEEGGEFDI